MKVYHYFNMKDNFVVAFIDILGFKQLLEKNVNTKLNNKKQQGLNIKFEKAYLNITNHYSQKYQHDKQIKFLCVSDSIVFSCHKTKINSLFEEMNWALNQLYCSEVGFRGGIAIGALHHDINIWGIAMNEAVELEAKKANYPIIVIKKVDYDNLNIDEDIKKYFKQHPTEESLLYYNYFDSWIDNKIKANKSIACYFSVYSKLIKRYFLESTDDVHKQRWTYLAKELINTIEVNQTYIRNENIKAKADGSGKLHLTPNDYIKIIREVADYKLE